MRVEKWIDEMVPMTDKVIGQEMAIVTATRNAVDVRKWVASRLMPNQYGDQPSGVTINNQTNVIVVSEEKRRVHGIFCGKPRAESLERPQSCLLRPFGSPT
jgi:hypothetical protein